MKKMLHRSCRIFAPNLVLTLLVFFLSHPVFAQDDSDSKADKGKRVGTITLTLQGGVQNITNHLENPLTGEKRQIIIDDYSSPYYTMILALRGGTHVEGWEDINNGFRYNRSNRGFFTDVEFGIKTYQLGNKGNLTNYPQQFTIKHVGGPNTLVDRYGNTFTSQTITLGSREEVGDSTVSVHPWQEVVDGVVVDTGDYTDNDYYNYLGIDTEDDDVRAMLESHGVASTKSMTIFINSYYHFNFFHTLFNYIGINLGSVFDASIGLSLRFNRYVDFTDFNRFVSYNSDNFDSVIGIISRNYINFGRKLRLKLSYMFPVVGFLANKFEAKNINAEEHIAEIAFDYYALPYVYLSAGFIYTYYPFNKNHSDYTIRTTPEGGDAEIIEDVRPTGRGIDFTGIYNDGFVQPLRTSWEAYIAVSVDVNF